MLFFELLQVATGNRDSLSVTPSEEEWYELYAMSKKQAMVGIVFCSFDRLPEVQRPPIDLLMRWFSAVQKIKKRNAEVDRKSIAVANRFLRAGFKALILKGQGVAQYYTHGEYRTSGDIDIWIDGERTTLVKFIHQYSPISKIVYHNISISPIGGTEVEVHFTPSWMNHYSTNKKLQDFFMRYKPSLLVSDENIDFSEKEGIHYKKLPVPSLEFNRVYILVHIYRHLFGEGIGLRQLMDYYHVLCQGFTEEERKETVKILKSLKMTKFTGAVMYVLQTVFGMQEKFMLLPPNEKEGSILLEEIMLAGNFGHFDERIKRKENESAIQIFFRHVGRNFRFVYDYPSEVLWSPLFKIWHFAWRKYWMWKVNRL